MGDYMKGKRAWLGDVTISDDDIPNVPDISDRRSYHKAISRPLPSTPTSASTTTLSWANGREVDDVPGETQGVGPGPRLAFGSACSADGECDMALGLRCLGSGLSSARCACGHATPVFVQEKDGGRCVRAKAIYESCAGDTECNFGNPNMRCVDFLCYCPLPFVLTDAQHCLPPQARPGVPGPSGVVPALLILFLLLVFGGVYVYHWAFRDREGFSRGERRSSDGDRQDSASSSTTRRTSSDIRISRKAEARSRCRRPEDDPRVARGRGLSPRRPPRYIRPKLLDSIVQTSDSSTSKNGVPDVQAKAISPVPPPRQRLIRRPYPEAEDVPVKVVRDAKAIGSSKESNERPHLAEPDDEAQTATVPTQLPQQKTESPHRHSSDQVEICIKAHKSNHDGRKAPLPAGAGLRSSRQKPRKKDPKPLKSSWLKMISGVMPFQGYFDRGKGKLPRRSLLRQRTTSTDMIITTDAAVQLENPTMVDDSQQVSEAPVTGGWFDTASVHHSKLDVEVTLGRCNETTVPPKRIRITENFVPMPLDGEAPRSSRTSSGSGTNTEISELVLREAQRHKDRDLAVATICHETISEPSLLQNTCRKSARSSKFSSSQRSSSSDHSAVVPASTTPGLFVNHSKILSRASEQEFDPLYLQMQGPNLNEMTELSSSCNATSDDEEISRKSAAGKDIEVAVGRDRKPTSTASSYHDSTDAFIHLKLDVRTTAKTGQQLVEAERVFDEDMSDSVLEELEHQFKRAQPTSSSVMSRGTFRKTKSTSDTTTEGQRRVSFLEKPFAEVLHIIEEEEGPLDERKGSSACKSKDKLWTSDSAVLKILELNSKQTNLEGTGQHPDDAPVEYQAETNVFKSQMVAVTRSGQSDHSPSLTTSQPINRKSKSSLVHHQPFCGSDEGPLAPSPSTSLSFVSSESGHNVMHPLTDLALLRGLLPFRRPKYETGDGRSRTGQLSRALSAGTHTEEAATRTSPQVFGRTQQSSVGDRRRGSSVWPRTGARQALVPMSTRGPSWAAMVGTQHYLRERSAFPRAPAPDSATAPNQTEYVCQQKKSFLALSSADATPEDPSRAMRPSTAKSEVFLTRSTTGLYRSSPCFQDSNNSSRNDLFLEPLRLRDLVVLRYPQFRWLTVQSEQHTDAGVQGSQRESQFATSENSSRNTPPPSQVDAVVKTLREIYLDTSTLSLHLSADCTGIASAVDDKNLADLLAAAKMAPLENVGFGSPLEATRPKDGHSGDASPSLINIAATGLDLIPSSPRKYAWKETLDSLEEISWPPTEGLILISDSSTAVSVAGSSPVAADCSSIAIKPSWKDSVQSSSAKVGTVSSSGRRLSTRILEGPSFESIYNSILQPQISTDPATDIGADGVVNSPRGTRGISLPGHLYSTHKTIDWDQRKTAAAILTTQSQVKLAMTCGTEAVPDVAASVSSSKLTPRRGLRSRSNETIAPTEDAERRRESSPAVLVHEALYPRPTQDREDMSSTPESTLDSAQVAQLGLQTTSELCLQDSSKSSTSSLGRRKMNVLAVDEGELSAFFSFEESGSNSSLLPDSTSLRFSEDSLSDPDASSSNQDDGNCGAN